MGLNSMIFEEQVNKESGKEAGFRRVGFSCVDFQMTFCGKRP